MTPPPPAPLESGDTPREAAQRLYTLCEELERRQVAGDQVEGPTALSQRFLSHLEGPISYLEVIETLPLREMDQL